jgi:hypothetical protein
VIYKYRELLQGARTPSEKKIKETGRTNGKNEGERVLALKIHSFPLRYWKSFVHCSGRSWDILRYTHRLKGCSRVPDDLFHDKIAESLPKAGERDNKLEWHKVREAH